MCACVCISNVLDDNAAALRDAVDRHLNRSQRQHIGRGVHVINELEHRKSRHRGVHKSARGRW